MTVDLILLRQWSEDLCRLSMTDPQQVVKALGIQGSATRHNGDSAMIDPPPEGTRSCEVGTVRGSFRSLSLTFTAPAIALATLEDAMGPGQPLRRVRRRRHQIAYRVVVTDAPFSCDVVAGFTEPPTASSVVTEVMLRRRRAWSPQPA